MNSYNPQAQRTYATISDAFPPSALLSSREFFSAYMEGSRRMPASEPPAQMNRGPRNEYRSPKRLIRPTPDTTGFPGLDSDLLRNYGA